MIESKARSVPDGTVMKFVQIWVVVAVMLTPALAGAQSLADVARAEAARRKAVPKAEKVYTNKDLQPDARASQPQAAKPAPSEDESEAAETTDAAKPEQAAQAAQAAETQPEAADARKD